MDIANNNVSQTDQLISRMLIIYQASSDETERNEIKRSRRRTAGGGRRPRASYVRTVFLLTNYYS